jgi:hypothetical protein
MSQDSPSNHNPTSVNPINYSPPSTPAAGDYAGPAPDKDAKMWAMLSHISSIVAYFICMPFVGPLVIWLMKKNEMPFVDDQGKEALNFQITLMLVFLILLPTLCIFVGVLLYPIVIIGAIVLTIIAGMKANEGIAYRYPFTLRLIK